MDSIRLDSGQTAELRDGIMVVKTGSSLFSYKMTTKHHTGGMLDVRGGELDSVIGVLRQLEEARAALAPADRQEMERVIAEQWERLPA